MLARIGAERRLSTPPHPPPVGVWIGAEGRQPARERRGPSGRVRARREANPAHDGRDRGGTVAPAERTKSGPAHTAGLEPVFPL